MTASRLRATLKGSPVIAVFDAVAVLAWCYLVWLTVADVRAGRMVAVIIDGLVLGLGAYYLTGQIRRYRDDSAPLRRSLIAAARKIGEDEIWLNRDEHKVFMAHRSLSAVQVRVTDEDDFRSIDMSGEGAVISVTYIMLRNAAGIVRQVGGVTVRTLPDGTIHADKERKSELRKWRDAWVLMRDLRRGYHDVDADEIQRIVAQIAAAERIGSGEGRD